MADPYSIVFVTVPDEDKAHQIAGKLVEMKLAACVNIVPKISSVYRWEGKVEKADELLLIAKTRDALVAEISEFVRKNHTYKVPEIIGLSIKEGNSAYLNWIGANTIFGKPKPGLIPGMNE